MLIQGRCWLDSNKLTQFTRAFLRFQSVVISLLWFLSLALQSLPCLVEVFWRGTSAWVPIINQRTKEKWDFSYKSTEETYVTIWFYPGKVCLQYTQMGMTTGAGLKYTGKKIQFVCKARNSYLENKQKEFTLSLSL